MANVILILILDPLFFFANLNLLLLGKKKKEKTLPPYCVLQSQPALGCWIATLDSKEEKKRKQSSELPFTSGAVIVIHIEVVWNTPG